MTWKVSRHRSRQLAVYIPLHALHPRLDGMGLRVVLPALHHPVERTFLAQTMPLRRASLLYDLMSRPTRTAELLALSESTIFHTARHKYNVDCDIPVTDISTPLL